MIDNEAKLRAALTDVLKKVLDDTTDHFYKRLLEIIDQEIYANDPEWYTRTYQFRQSWMSDKAEVIGQIVQSAIFQDPLAMKWNDILFQHGNVYVSVANQYNNPFALADILNDGTSNAGFGFYPVKATQFWDKFIKDIETNFQSVFLGNCKKYGITATGGVF